MNQIKVSENFMLSEFQCRHCGTVILYSELLAKLQKLRTYLGKPVVINSGYRCEEHNRAVGGAANSYHMRGMAADISVEGHTPYRLAELVDDLDFGGIIIYNNFVHVDVRSQRWRGGDWSQESSTTNGGSDSSEQEGSPSEKQSFIWTLLRRFLTRLGFMKNVM